MNEPVMGRDGSADVGLPLVSVVICVYNAGRYLRPSVLSIVNQTYRHLDIVIVDDGSNDGCVETIADLLTDSRVRLFRQDNATRPVALNRALDLAYGEYYAIQDADDVSDPRRIELQVQAIRPRPHLAAVFCGFCLLVDGRRIAPLMSYKGEDECRVDIDLLRVPAHDATGLFRRSVVGDMRFDPSLPLVEAWDYVLRVGERYPMVVLGECLYAYRWHPDSITQSDPQRRNTMVTEALERACERRGTTYRDLVPQGRQPTKRSVNSVMDNGIASVFVESVISQRAHSRRWGAVRTGWQCARLHPLDPYYYKALAYALLPVTVLDLVRGAKRRRRQSHGQLAV